MKRVLFIDRDGTLIVEPEGDYQVDSLEKLEFMPGVFRNLYRLKKTTPFELVMVSNQDGMGTGSYPEDAFLTPHNKVLKAFENEGVSFDAVHIDSSLPGDHSPNRKPGTGMLTGYFDDTYDLERSYVIGDRLTDIELAKNLGAKAIWLASPDRTDELVKHGLSSYCELITESWDEIYRFLRASLRTGKVVRRTRETDVEVTVALDGSGRSRIETGLGFLDHMLEQIARHGQVDLVVQTRGDLHVDEHHTVEDTALALGEAFYKALGDKRGISRYGFTLPMDESLAQVAVDFSGRPWLVWNAMFNRERIGDVPTELFFHFFKSFSDAARCNLNIKVEGKNEHHKIEAIFKAFAKAIHQAVAVGGDNEQLPTTKGML